MTGWAVPGFVQVRQSRVDPVGRRVVARYPMTRRFVSVTYLSPEFLADTEFRDRYATESSQLMQVREARIERVRHYVQADQGAAVVADYTPGTPLRAVLHEEGTVRTAA